MDWIKFPFGAFKPVVFGIATDPQSVPFSGEYPSGWVEEGAQGPGEKVRA